MPCFYPRQGWFDISSGERKGRPLMRFPIGEDPYDWEAGQLRCRVCIGCRSDRACDISLRAAHEAQMHDAGCFLTLTYDRESLPVTWKYSSDEGQRLALAHPQRVVPYGGSLRREDVVVFMKRLRKRVHEDYGERVRAYVVGEYGGRTQRPHYHALLFGFDFRHDRIRVEDSRGGHPQWSSKLLDELWSAGMCRIGELGQQSAQYAAKYALKSLGGKQELRGLVGGGMVEVEPAFDSLPHGRALGLPWLDRFWSDVFPLGAVVLRGGRQVPVPLAYLKVCKERDPEVYERVSEARALEGLKRLEDAMPARLRVREEVAHAKASRSQRDAV